MTTRPTKPTGARSQPLRLAMFGLAACAFGILAVPSATLAGNIVVAEDIEVPPPPGAVDEPPPPPPPGAPPPPPDGYADPDEPPPPPPPLD